MESSTIFRWRLNRLTEFLHIRYEVFAVLLFKENQACCMICQVFVVLLVKQSVTHIKRLLHVLSNKVAYALYQVFTIFLRQSVTGCMIYQELAVLLIKVTYVVWYTKYLLSFSSEVTYVMRYIKCLLCFLSKWRTLSDISSIYCASC